jgi:glycosyltransferase involved in cell wall biosynthesis
MVSGLRILVVSQYFWPENFRINELVEQFVARGHQVTILTGKPNYPDGVVFPAYRASPGDFDEYRGASVIRVPLWPRGRGPLSLLSNYLSFAMSAAVVGAWRLRGRKFDVLFVFEPSPVTVGFPAIFLRRLKRAPLVFWVLDQWPETLAAVGIVRSPRLLRAIGRMVSFIYDRCDAVLGQSRAMAKLIENYVRDPARVAYFPNWVERIGEVGAAAPAPEVPEKRGHFDVMFAGNIGESQDFGAVISAAELLRADTQVRWLIVGDGRMSDWVRSEISRRGLDGRVIMLGRHPLERMPSFYRQADALLLSLRDDPVFAMTVPGKLQSYLAAGIPVIGMLNGEGSALINESGSGLTCPAGDSQGLAAIVRGMRDLSAADRAAMGARGRAYAEREFDRDKLVADLESRMHRLVAFQDHDANAT